jgi:hypothetical protein
MGDQQDFLLSQTTIMNASRSSFYHQILLMPRRPPSTRHERLQAIGAEEIAPTDNTVDTPRSAFPQWLCDLRDATIGWHHMTPDTSSNDPDDHECIQAIGAEEAATTDNSADNPRMTKRPLPT